MQRAKLAASGEARVAYAAQVLEDNPAFYWRLGESSGTTAVDETGTHNGTYVNSPTLGSDGLLAFSTDTAVVFDQTSSQYVRLTDHADLNTGGPWGQRTYEVWFRTTRLDSRQFVVAVGGTDRGWNIMVENNGRLYYYIYNNINDDGTTPWNHSMWTDQVYADTIHHAVMVQDVANSSMKAYLDGVLIGSSSDVGNLFGHLDGAIGYGYNSTEIYTGADTSGGTNPFDGTIDEVALYNHVLTSDQITKHYELGDFNPFALPESRAFSAVGYNGLMDLLGTDGGRRTFINPADSISVDYPVVATESSANDTDLTAIEAFRQSASFNNREYFISSNATQSEWWKVDFRDRRIVVDHYGIQGRDGTTANQPRNWKLQGSNDDINWTDLDEQVSNSSVGNGTWFDGAVSDTTSWRFLRIIMTGSNSDGNWYLALGEVEFWGTIEAAPVITSPLDILWYTAFWAEDPNWTNPGDGNAVSSWRNAGVGDWVDVTQGTGTKQPLYRSSVAALNDQPAIDFDGSDDLLQAASGGTNLTEPLYVFVVADLPSPDSNWRYIHDHRQGGADPGTNRLITGYTSGNEWRMYVDNSISAGSPAAGAKFIRSYFAGSNSSLEVDGTEVLTGNPGGHLVDGLTLGSSYDENNPFNIYMAFLGVIRADLLTPKEESYLRSWSQTHYGTA